MIFPLYIGGQRRHRQISEGGSSLSSFLERFSPKKKISEKTSKSRAEKKRSGHNESERSKRISKDKRNERRKDKRKDEKNDKKRATVPYREPSQRESPFQQVNQGYSNDSDAVFDDEEISL